ncbi:hypothetical protein LZ32DRAFT_307881 [Colletotrichum eremochloae]|nr:hypothetical protein LZ32DRAFT_307881 [Colletotrichum eremochloae]
MHCFWDLFFFIFFNIFTLSPFPVLSSDSVLDQSADSSWARPPRRNLWAVRIHPSHTARTRSLRPAGTLHRTQLLWAFPTPEQLSLGGCLTRSSHVKCRPSCDAKMSKRGMAAVRVRELRTHQKEEDRVGVTNLPLSLCIPNARDFGRHTKVGVVLEFDLGFFLPPVFGKVMPYISIVLGRSSSSISRSTSMGIRQCGIRIRTEGLEEALQRQSTLC